MTAPLYHALYTNAAGEGGRGFRTVLLAPSWPARDRARLERWLRDLAPTDAYPRRCAAGAFRLGGTVCACLAGHRAAFGQDHQGRVATLVHALIAPLDERRPPDHWQAALLALLGAFDPGDLEPERRLERLLERCRAARERPLEPPAVADTRILDHPLSAGVLSAAAAGAPRIPVADADDPAPALCAIAAFLPPRLRLAFRWAVGLHADGSATVAARLPPSPDALDGRAVAYLRWLRAHDAGARAAVAGDWAIRAWDELPAAAGVAGGRS